MRHDKLERELNMLLMLAGNRSHTMEEVCERLGISRRNFYYYMEFFRGSGFIVNKQGGRFSIDRSSPFFKKIIETVSFTEDETVLMHRLLNMLDDKNAIAQNLKDKLNRFYDLNILHNGKMSERNAHVVSQLYDAIKLKQMVILKNYTSLHGKSQRDRLVEPFLFMDGNNKVRCYEPATDMNKTFKVSRINDVEVLADHWQHEDRHKQVHTDIFMFSEAANCHLTAGRCGAGRQDIPLSSSGRNGR